MQRTTTKKSPPTAVEAKSKVPANDSTPSTPIASAPPSRAPSRATSFKEESAPGVNHNNDNSNTHGYVVTGKEIALKALTNATAIVIAHPRLSTFVVSQLIVSSVPVAIFFVGLAISTTFAAVAFTFFAFLFLAPVAFLSLFLGLCLWGGIWAAWLLYEAVRARYLANGNLWTPESDSGRAIGNGNWNGNGKA